MVLEFLEFLELFWIFFGTGNFFEKIHFFRIVLELFLNSEFLKTNFLGYNFSSRFLFGYPICDKKMISILHKATLITGLVIR